MKELRSKGLSILLVVVLFFANMPVFAVRAETLHPTGWVPDSWETVIEHLAPPTSNLRAALPSAIDLTSSFPPPGNQGSQWSCSAWAVAYALKSHQEQVKRNWGITTAAHQFSPGYVYNQLCRGLDRGIGINEAMALIVSQGVCSLASFPYNQFDYISQPTAAQKLEAANYKATSWNSVLGIEAIKARLAEGDGVVVGINVYPDFDRLSPSNPIYDEIYGSARGSHAICLIGYDDSMQAFKFINSWDANWGINGYGWIAYDMLYAKDITMYNSATGWVINNQSVSPFTLSYDANGGTGAPPAQDSPTHVSSVIPSMSNGFTLYYNSNGGSVSSGSKFLPLPFKEWNTNISGTGTAYAPGAAYTAGVSATLYAQWDRYPLIGPLPTPTNGPGVFMGWFTAAGAGTLLTSSTMVSSNMTIYAHWETPIVLNTNRSVSVTISNNDRRAVQFIAPATGDYIFESSNNGVLDPVAYASATE
ncbi:MAG: InlB B-repeat-containing protein, partial [Peptococcaceae bacterium]|nr:InlB B-repeat-containing protein [Peptococcaceae bacterium]